MRSRARIVGCSNDSVFLRTSSFVLRHCPPLPLMAVTVARPKLNWRERIYFPAILSGLLITINHFKRMLLGRTKVTMQYPEERRDADMPDYYRGAPALVRDTDGHVRCVACQLCECICP